MDHGGHVGRRTPAGPGYRWSSGALNVASGPRRLRASTFGKTDFS
jgi:hypothetical protein